MKWLLVLIALVAISCSNSIKLVLDTPQQKRQSGTTLFKQMAAYDWQQRDSLALTQIFNGNVPTFITHLVPVALTAYDSITKQRIKATIYVTPDYISVGTDKDWVRVPFTSMAAQRLADTLDCFLPTRKVVDAIYAAAKVKLEPVPMFAFRDSTPTMYQHHLIIEGQRKGQEGLIAGIKKDVVITAKLKNENRLNKVAIYGWHQLNSKPIQPLYTGHINWYTDYSHGVRLIYRKVKVGKEWLDYTAVLQHPVWRRLLCDEEYCDFYKYPY